LKSFASLRFRNAAFDEVVKPALFELKAALALAQLKLRRAELFDEVID
jgi:hypothetical protein